MRRSLRRRGILSLMGTEFHQRLGGAGQAPKATIVTWHGEHQTLWHVVDGTAAGDDQPAVIRTFSSRHSTREDARRFLAGFTPRSN